MGQIIPAHVSHIDPEDWPGVAIIPEGRFIGLRSRQAEARFATGCDKAGISLLSDDPANPADLTVHHEELFVRLADSGWLGLAEGYMAGEWEAEDLTEVLVRLLSVGFQPRGTFGPPKFEGSGFDQGGELPPELVKLSSTEGVARGGAMFASGVPTTVRTQTDNQAPGAGRRNVPATYYVDVTTLGDPADVERADLPDAQLRCIESLLDSAKVATGSDVLEYPSGGGRTAIQAALRGASVDVLTADGEHAAGVLDITALEGVADRVHVHLIPEAIPTRQHWRGRYDSIVSSEKLELVGKSARPAFMKTLDRMLTSGGFIGMQTVVATESFNASCAEAVLAIRAYAWPALNYPTVKDIHRVVDRETGLRITAETFFGGHYEQGIRMQRELFESQLREAAAAGFDPVFRRFWVYQFALREAMLRLGFLDAVQMTLTSRQRSGR